MPALTLAVLPDRESSKLLIFSGASLTIAVKLTAPLFVHLTSLQVSCQRTDPR
jgi:hypothetical protein